MSEISGIVNYEACWHPLNRTYFEQRPEENGFSKQRVGPEMTTKDYVEFNESQKVNADIQEDMLEFERYAKFDVNSLECVQKREAIIKDINMSTPAATYEGSLEEWITKPEDGVIELHENMNDEPHPQVIDLVTNFIFTSNQEPAMPVLMTEAEKIEYKKQLEVKHVWQLDAIDTAFQVLLDLKSKKRHKQIRE